MAGFLRNLTWTLMLVGVAVGGYWWLTMNEQARALKELEALNAQLEQHLAARQAMIDRLSRSRRIAHLHVNDQQTNESGAVSRTSVLFIELDDGGGELARQTFTVPGDVLFVDALTIKFDHERVAEGNPLLGHTLVLLRRVYSELLPPKDGFPIDTPGAIPPGYATTEPSRFEQMLWQNFWAFATDAERAREVGVRVAQGEAVYKPVRTGQTYELIADAAGGLSLVPLPNTVQAGETAARAPR